MTKIIFAKSTAANGRELWIIDAASPSGRLLKDVTPGVAGSTITLYSSGVVGSKAFILADENAGTERDLWFTDGSTAGTTKVQDFSGVDGLRTPLLQFQDGGKTYLQFTYSVADAQGFRGALWETNGTVAGTQEALKIAVTFAYNPSWAQINNKTIGYATVLGVDGLYSFNPTTESLSLIKLLSPYAPILAGNTVAVFAATPNPNDKGAELWRTDGTAAGTYLIADISPGPNSSYPQIRNLPGQDKWLITAYATPGTGWLGMNETAQWILLASDGTANGTIRVGAATGQPTLGANPSFLNGSEKSGAMFFWGKSAAHGYELWQTNGTTAGTRLVLDINQGAGDSYVHSSQSNGVWLNSYFYFLASTPSTGIELWRTNGTAVGTTLVKDFEQGTANGRISHMAVQDGMLYLSRTIGDGTTSELYKSNGTAAGTVKLTEFATPQSSGTLAGQVPFILVSDGVNTAPSNIAVSKTSVREFAAVGTDVGVLSATDAQGGTMTYTLLNSAGGRFKVTGNVLEVANGLLSDYEQDATHTVQVRVTDAGGLSFVKSLNLTLTNVNPEVIVGNSAANTLWGGTLADNFNGAGGNDNLNGAAGNDVLNGGLGNDTLTGGANNDFFVFNSALSSTLNKDIVTDFNVANDTLRLDNAVFTQIIQASSATGVTLLSKFLTKNATGAATSLDHRIIYETDTGLLRYDADGNKAGGRSAIIFADLPSGLIVTNADFLVI